MSYRPGNCNVCGAARRRTRGGFSPKGKIVWRYKCPNCRNEYLRGWRERRKHPPIVRAKEPHRTKAQFREIKKRVEIMAAFVAAMRPALVSPFDAFNDGPTAVFRARWERVA